MPIVTDDFLDAGHLFVEIKHLRVGHDYFDISATVAVKLARDHVFD